MEDNKVIYIFLNFRLKIENYVLFFYLSYIFYVNVLGKCIICIIEILKENKGCKFCNRNWWFYLRGVNK